MRTEGEDRWGPGRTAEDLGEDLGEDRRGSGEDRPAIRETAGDLGEDRWGTGEDR